MNRSRLTQSMESNAESKLISVLNNSFESKIISSTALANSYGMTSKFDKPQVLNIQINQQLNKKVKNKFKCNASEAKTLESSN